MLRQLIPHEYNFFESFDQAASHAVSAARLLLKLTEHYGDADPIAREPYTAPPCRNRCASSVEPGRWGSDSRSGWVEPASRS